MRFNELNEKDIELIKETYLNKNGLSWEKKAIELSKLFEVSERTIRKWVAEKFFLKEKEQPISEQYELAKKRQFDKDKQRFIITWAQSNTNVHKKFLENIEAYAKEINADIHVILGRYKNPTSLSASDKIKQEETWSPATALMPRAEGAEEEDLSLDEYDKEDFVLEASLFEDGDDLFSEVD